MVFRIAISWIQPLLCGALFLQLRKAIYCENQQLSVRSNTQSFTKIVKRSFSSSISPNDILSKPSTKFRLAVGVACKPKESYCISFKENCKALRGCDCGEDAFMVSSYGKVLGIADGVGGWRLSGVDPSEFSCALMNHVHDIAKEISFKDKSPSSILSEAYSRLISDNIVKNGSSTACISKFHKSTGELEISNIGDSGIIIFRGKDKIFRSQEQTHYFNCPFQLAARDKSEVNKGYCDMPSDAISTKLKLQDGDIVIMATDGLFDNMYDEEISQIIHGELEVDYGEVKMVSTPNAHSIKCYDYNTEALAIRLVEQAYIFSKDTFRKSPFSTHGTQQGYNFSGGKPDDITVIAARVVEEYDIELSNTPEK